MIPRTSTALAIGLIVSLALAGCGGSGDGDGIAEPLPTETGVAPSDTPTATPEAPPEGLPAGAYLRLHARATLASGEQLELELTSFEPTIETATPAANVEALADGCFLYNDSRAYLETQPGVEHYYSVSTLVVRGDATVASRALEVHSLAAEAASESGSAVFVETDDCHSYVHGSGEATLLGYLTTFGYTGLENLLEWQFPGFSDAAGPGGTSVTFDQCSVELSAHATTVATLGAEWSLRDEGWRCAVAPTEYE